MHIYAECYVVVEIFFVNISQTITNILETERKRLFEISPFVTYLKIIEIGENTAFWQVDQTIKRLDLWNVTIYDYLSIWLENWEIV